MQRIKFVIATIVLHFWCLPTISYAANGAIADLDIHPALNYNYGDQLGNIVGQSDLSFPIAMQFVKSTGLHKSLSLLLLDSIKNNDFIENAIKERGFPDVKASVVANIRLTATQYRQRWETLLATIYGNQFGARELKSILDEGENSPYYLHFIAAQNKMNTSSTLMESTIFKEAHIDLIKTLEKSFKI